MRHHHQDGVMPGLAAAEAAEIDCGRQPVSLVAHPPSKLNPTKGEAPTLTGDEGLWDRDKADRLIVADLDGERKPFATLRARFALAGFALLDLSDGSLLVARWNFCKPLPDLAAARRLLKQIGGAA